MKSKRPPGRPPKKYLTIYRHAGVLCIPAAITRYLLTDYIDFSINTDKDNPHVVVFSHADKGYKLQGPERSYKLVTIYGVLSRLGIPPDSVAGNEYEWTQNKRNDLFTFDLSKPINAIDNAPTML